MRFGRPRLIHHAGLTKKLDAIGYTDCLYRYPLRLGSDVLRPASPQDPLIALGDC